MHACTHARSHACTRRHARMQACRHVCMNECTHVSLRNGTYARMHACTHALLVVPILACTFKNPLRQTAEIQALPKLNWKAPHVLRCGDVLYPGNRHSPCYEPSGWHIAGCWWYPSLLIHSKTRQDRQPRSKRCPSATGRLPMCCDVGDVRPVPRK